MTATRVVRLVAAAGLAMALVGCGSSGGDDTAPGSTDTTAATAVDAEGVAPAVVTTPTPAELDIEACTGARAPVFVERDTYQQGTTTNGLRPPPDGSAMSSFDPPADPTLSLWARAHSRRDPADDSGAIVVQHAGGDPTVLGGRGLVVGFPGGRSWIGDLDGDGIDEVMVISTRPGGTGTIDTVIVPGTVAAGIQDPFASGIILPDHGHGIDGVGDIDGDGADDVVMGAQVVSGRALMAVGAGGSLTEAPTPIATADPSWTAPAAPRGLLTLTPGTVPVAGVLTPEGLSLSTRPATLLRTDDALVDAGSPPVLTAYRSGGHRIVTLRTDTGRSGLTLTQMWDLDGVCPD